MARQRKKDDHWIEPVVQLAGLVVLLSLISPQVRQVISTLGIIAIGFIGLVVISFICFGVCRFVIRSERAETVDHNVDWEAPDVEVNTDIKTPPQTTANLIDQLRSIDWFQFEQLSALIYRKLGYTVTRHGGANPDGGIDIVIEKDGQRTAVQCKHWKVWNVGVKPMREFLGALTAAQMQRGILIALSGCTNDAKQFADKNGIEIVNEVELARMLEKTDARFDPEMLAILQDKRKLCPRCERVMVLRTVNKGVGIGRQFWGCSTFPKCRFTMPLS